MGLCDKVKLGLKQRGFCIAADLHWTLQGGAEETFQAILESAGVDKGDAPSVLQCLQAGSLRRVFHVKGRRAPACV